MHVLDAKITSIFVMVEEVMPLNVHLVLLDLYQQDRMLLHVSPVLLDNQLLYGTRSVQTVLLACTRGPAQTAFLVPWVHTVIKVTLHAPHANQIAFRAKDLHSVSPAHPD